MKQRQRQWWWVLPQTAAPRLLITAVVGAAAAVAVARSHPELSVLSGIAAAGLVFVCLGWAALWPMNAEQTRSHAGREIVPPLLDELLVVGAALGGLGGIVGLLLAGGTRASSLSALLAMLGVVMAWAAVHLMYTVRYAYLYYSGVCTSDGKPGGIDFNDDVPPAFRDFFYFSYNLGMTYQVSDTSVTTTVIRGVALRQCLISYLFGMAIMATTINLVAGILL